MHATIFITTLNRFILLVPKCLLDTFLKAFCPTSSSVQTKLKLITFLRKSKGIFKIYTRCKKSVVNCCVPGSYAKKKKKKKIQKSCRFKKRVSILSCYQKYKILKINES